MNRVHSTDQPGELTEITDQPDIGFGAVHQLAEWSWNNSEWCGGQSWNLTTYNSTESDYLAAAGVNYGAALLVLIPMLTVFGNSLVVVSVIREKTLRTVTNYFIVSLATSDVMVALLVMPLSIYGEVMTWTALSY